MAQINIRIDDELKEKAEVFLEELGFTFSSAFNVFIRQAMRERRIPFDIDLRSLYPSGGDYRLTKAELVLRASEMKNGSNVVINELVEVEDGDSLIFKISGSGGTKSIDILACKGHYDDK